MNFKFLFKIFTLLLALCATVYAMYLLNTGHMSDFLTSLGISKPTQTLNWCSNRVTRIQDIGLAWQLNEEDQKWWMTFTNQEPKTVEYLDVEKWLAKYCILEIELYKGTDVLDCTLDALFNVTFNDGNSARVQTLCGEIYQINEVIFKSEEFKEGLAALKALLKY